MFFRVFAAGREASSMFRAQTGGNAEHEAQKVRTELVHSATSVWLH